MLFVLFFIHSSVDGHFGLLPSRGNYKQASKNSEPVDGHMLFFSPSKTLEEESLGVLVDAHLIFLRNCQISFPKGFTILHTHR